MTDVVGTGIYKLATDNSGVKSGLSAAEKEMAASAKRQKALWGVVGGAAGAIFGAAAKNAVDLTNATAKWRAETGATAAEAQAAQATMNNLFRQNLQGYDEIGATLSALQTDLGLTQAQAAKAAQSFLDFANATGISSTDAVKNLDDVTAAYNLKAGASKGIMDLLVASHQKYGGSVQENTAALIKMAPALQAMNVGVEQGNALLNLFADSGVKASAAGTALSSAVGKLDKGVKGVVAPGTSLPAFLNHLQNMSNDGKRATEAIAVFGTRAGPALANALGKSKTALHDHHIRIRDVKDASKNAGDAITGTFGAQAQQMLKDFTGALGGIAAQFGGVLIPLSLIGPQIVKVFGALGAAAGLTFSASLLATVAGGLAIVGLAAGLWYFTMTADGQKQLRTAGATWGQAIADTFVPELDKIPPKVQTQLWDVMAEDTGKAMGDILDLVSKGFDWGTAPFVAVFNGAVAGVNDYVIKPVVELFTLFTGPDGVIANLVKALKDLPNQVAGLGHLIIDPIVTAMREGINNIIRMWNSLDFSIPAFSIPAFSIHWQPNTGNGDLDKALAINLGAGPFPIWSGTGDLIPDIGLIGGRSGALDSIRHHLSAGMPYIPYDGFQATLHRGERVVPAAENNGWGGRQRVDIHIHDENGGLARAGIGAGELAGAIASALSGAGARYTPPLRYS